MMYCSEHTNALAVPYRVYTNALEDTNALAACG